MDNASSKQPYNESAVNRDSRDRQLAEILAQLTEQPRAGGQPDVQAAIDAHSELADELRELWAAVLVADVVAAGSAGDATLSSTPPAGSSS